MNVLDAICEILRANGFENEPCGMIRKQTGCEFSWGCLKKYNTVADFQLDWSYSMPEEMTTFIVYVNSKEVRLAALASKAKWLPVEYLENYIRDFIAMEKYEEADVIKKEIERRPANGQKFLYYLTDKDGKVTQITPKEDIKL